VVAPWLALFAAVLGESVARLPADACAATARGAAVRRPEVQLLVAAARSAAVLGFGVGTTATVLALASTWSWGAAAGAVAIAVLPLAAAPITAAPLLGAPLRVGLLVWCATRAAAGLGGSPTALAALSAGAVAAAALGMALGTTLGPRRCGPASRQAVRDSTSTLVASPLILASGVVPVLIGLPLAPWELWRYCTRRRGLAPVGAEGPGADTDAALFVVYLDGVGKTWLPPTTVARGLDAALGAALGASTGQVQPGVRFLTDVLPYSPLQSPVTERAWSGPIWRWLRRHAYPMLVGHNILQTVVAADARYQQAYGHAVADAAWDALRRAGCRRGDRLVVLGYSGGAVVGAAAADPLVHLAGEPDVLVVSIGGFLDGRVLPERAKVHHLASDTDALERLGRAMFPARWPVFGDSAWNRALASGAVVCHPVPGSRHVGPRGYLAPARDTPQDAGVVVPVAGTPRGVAHRDLTGNLTRTVTLLAELLVTNPPG
jgi:hypothetical protein